MGHPGARSRWRRRARGTLLLVVAGCAPSAAGRPVPEARPDDCLTPEDPGAALLDTITVVSADPESPNDGRDRLERVARRHLVETLVRVACDGQLRPALAQSWAVGPGGEVAFTLRPRLRFADGTPLDAGAAGAALRRRWPELEVEPAGDGVLRVRLDSSLPDPLPVLTDPALGLERAGAAGDEPIGSGPYRIERREGAAVVAAPADPAFAGPVLRFEPLPAGLDPRDALDRGLGTGRVDVVVSRDPAVLEYARARADLRVVPLAWDRTYVVAVAGAATEVPPEERRALARDAVRADARSAEPPFWWADDARCSRAAAAPANDPPPVIAYARADPTSRELAERLLALAAAPDPPSWLGAWPRRPGRGPPRLLPLDSLSAPAGRAPTAAAAVIVALPRLPPFDCPYHRLPPAGLVPLPLIDTRAHLVVRRGTPMLLLHGDGTFVVQPRPLRPARPLR